MTRYIRAVDTAKLLRKALRARFPGQRFSVRTSTYAGGASIDIYWTDGPSSRAVDRVADHYQGADFDGMVDLKTYRKTEHRGEQVHFGADYIFTRRTALQALECACGWTGSEQDLESCRLREPRAPQWKLDITLCPECMREIVAKYQRGGG